MYRIGSKVTLNLRTLEGRIVQFPGIVVGEPTFSEIELPARPATDVYPAKPARTIRASHQLCVSLRTTNPDLGDVVEYLRPSFERTDNPRFTAPRFSTVEGLDAENGATLDLEVLVQRANDENVAFLEARAEAQAQPELAL